MTSYRELLAEESADMQARVHKRIKDACSEIRTGQHHNEAAVSDKFIESLKDYIPIPPVD